MSADLLSPNLYIICGIAVMALCTAAIRFAPFIIFRKKVPRVILYLEKILPEAVMAMLLVYCLKGVNFLRGNHGIPEIIALLVVFVLHKWRHNTLLSILGGTILYMVLLQVM